VEPTANLLSRIRIVLVAPQHPGNIGSAARAMKTMGLRELVLVDPREFPHAEATALAAGADDVLEAAKVFMTLEEAVADCSHVAATTARQRYVATPLQQPREWASRLAQVAPTGTIALLFGRERTGLTNEELDHAREGVIIPADPAFSSLNLAAAVQILCYELRLADGAPSEAIAEHQPVSQAALEHFFGHLERVLIRTRFLDPAAPRFIMRRMRRLFSRSAPDEHEANILRGILGAIEETLEHPETQVRSAAAMPPPKVRR
jgi:TrmH family RNA methyltransferase